MNKILCFGDSNTWGHNPLDFSKLEKCWPVVVREMLTDCEIIEDGVCGRATKFGESETNGIIKFREKYLSGENEFDLIIIMLGTNDLLNQFDCSPEETAETLGTYIDEYREKFCENKTKFLLVSPIYINEYMLKHPVFKDLYSEKSIIKSHEFADNIKEIAKQKNVYFMDAAQVASASNIDGIHMEETEHKKFAEAITERIKSILF